jgi:hypothetical protein
MRRRRETLDASMVSGPICAVTPLNTSKVKGLGIHGNSFSVVIFLIKGKSTTVDSVNFME